MIGIYRITKKDTKQMYIGQSKNIERRMREHFSYSCSYSYIDNSIRKHGPEDYQIDILVTFDEYNKDVLDDAEQYFIAAYNTYENPKHYNLTGFFRVSKVKTKSFNQGFSYVYQYYDDNGKPKRIRSKNLSDLEEKVHKKGLIWMKINKINAEKTLKFEKNKFETRYKQTNTGFFRVHKTKPNGGKSVFRYIFRDKNGKNKSINSVSIRKLKEKIEKKGLVWKVIDEEQAKKTWEAENE